LLILGDKYTGKYNNLPKSLKQLSLKTSLATYHYPSGTCGDSRIDNIDIKIFPCSIIKNNIKINSPTSPDIEMWKYEHRQNVALNNLPQLILLILSNHQNKQIKYAPQSLKNLICGYDYNYEIDNLSQNLNTITLPGTHNKQIKKVSPKLTKIILHGQCGQGWANIFKKKLLTEDPVLSSNYKKINNAIRDVYVYDNNQINFNFIGKFENLNDDLATILNNIGIIELEHEHYLKNNIIINSSSVNENTINLNKNDYTTKIHSNIEDNISNDFIGKIIELFDKDFSFFNYNKEFDLNINKNFTNQKKNIKVQNKIVLDKFKFKNQVNMMININ